MTTAKRMLTPMLTPSAGLSAAPRRDEDAGAELPSDPPPTCATAWATAAAGPGCDARPCRGGDPAPSTTGNDAVLACSSTPGGSAAAVDALPLEPAALVAGAPAARGGVDDRACTTASVALCGTARLADAGAVTGVVLLPERRACACACCPVLVRAEVAAAAGAGVEAGTLATPPVTATPGGSAATTPAGGGAAAGAGVAAGGGSTAGAGAGAGAVTDAPEDGGGTTARGGRSAAGST
jgi:hypothetical protein